MPPSPGWRVAGGRPGREPSGGPVRRYTPPGAPAPAPRAARVVAVRSRPADIGPVPPSAHNPETAMRSTRSTVVLSAFLLAGCGGGDAPAPSDTAAPSSSRAALPACDPGDGGLVLPEGRCGTGGAEGVAAGRATARHRAVAPNGDVYVAIQGARRAETPDERGGIVALRDTDGDGKADQRATFGPEGGTGVEIR